MSVNGLNQRVMPGMVIDMLGDGARGVRAVLAAAKSRMTCEDDLAFQRSIWKPEVWSAT